MSTTLDGHSTSQQVMEALGSHADGRTFVITGASISSIGSSMAINLARHASPKCLILASRTASRVDPVLADIKAANPSVPASFVQLDLTDLDSVRRAADEILSLTGGQDGGGIDVLVNSAGLMAVKDYTVDNKGIEIQFSANHVGHFLLTNLLLPALVKPSSSSSSSSSSSTTNPPARIINLSSAGHQISPYLLLTGPTPNSHSHDYSQGATYDPFTAYGRSKSANIHFTHSLSTRCHPHPHPHSSSILSLAVHPGFNRDTNLIPPDFDPSEIAEAIPLATAKNNSCLLLGNPREKEKKENENWYVWDSDPPLKTYEQIAATPLAAALDPNLGKRGKPVYVDNCREVEPAHGWDEREAEELWRVSEGLVGMVGTK